MNTSKGQGLSINMLVVIALAVFVVFLVIGFVTSGFGYFAGGFQVAKTTDGNDIARGKCLQWCTQYTSQGSPVIDRADTSGLWYGRLIGTHSDVDTNGDGDIDGSDSYTCRGAANAMVSASECTLTTVDTTPVTTT